MQVCLLLNYLYWFIKILMFLLEREGAIAVLDGYSWKGKVLKATFANPVSDPLVKKRKQDFGKEQDRDYSKKPRTVAEGSEPLGHLSYPEQLVIKQKNIEDVLRKFKWELKKANDIQSGRRSFDNSKELICELRDVIGSPKTEGYRNKCEFTIGKSIDGEVMVGNRLSSYASGNTSVASVEELKMPTEKMKLATNLLRDFVVESGLQPFSNENYEGTFRNLTIRQTRLNDGLMLILGIHPQNMTKEEKEKLQEDFVAYFTEGVGKVLNVTSIYYEEIQKRQSGQQGNIMKHIYGETHIKENILGLEFRISALSFFQANSYGAEKLYQLAIDLADVKKDTTVLDICCGTGTIGLCFANHCKQVYGMEIIPEAIADAKVNAENNGIKNAEFKAGNADDLIYSMLKQAPIVPGEDVVAIVDPPRAGLQQKSIIQLRNSTKIKRLVYISCSPSQVIKNFVDLCKNSTKTMKGEKFIPKVAVPVDLFPNTPHCELAVLFERQEREPSDDEEETPVVAAAAETPEVTTEEPQL